MAIEDGSSGGDNAIVSGQLVVRKILLLHVKHLKLKIEVQRWTFVEKRIYLRTSASGAPTSCESNLR